MLYYQSRRKSLSNRAPRYNFCEEPEVKQAATERQPDVASKEKGLRQKP
jgi:hypothetical protein